jgi:hypothetical protein
MLKQIHKVVCAPALDACSRLQMELLAWLCDPNVQGADLTEANLTQVLAGRAVEANWLWTFLNKEIANQPLLTRAQAIANMCAVDKTALLNWAVAAVDVMAQFQPNPAAWPANRAAVPDSDWIAFKTLMEAFYEKGLKGGLPYDQLGHPVASGGVSYAIFKDQFDAAHQQTSVALQLCALCGGEREDQSEFDHWIGKAEIPVLSVHSENLLPICHACNKSGGKGEKPVHDNGVFNNWFHPYYRSAYGKAHVQYRLPVMTAHYAALNPADDMKVQNLDLLVGLSPRWTKRFKAEYRLVQNSLRSVVKKGDVPNNRIAVQEHLNREKNRLRPERAWYEVHLCLFECLQVQARTDAWLTELEL